MPFVFATRELLSAGLAHPRGVSSAMPLLSIAALLNACAQSVRRNCGVSDTNGASCTPAATATAQVQLEDAPAARPLRAPTPRLSVAGRRAFVYLLLAALLWALTNQVIDGVDISPGVVGLGLVMLLHAPAIGVADPAALRTTAAFGFMLYMDSLICINTAFSRTGIIDEFTNFLNLDGVDVEPVLMYMLIAWSVTALNMLVGNVVSASLSSAFWLNYVMRREYCGRLTPFRVALAVSFPGAIFITPFQNPPVQVGLAVNKLPLDWRRIHRYLATCAVLELLVLVPIASVIVAYM